MDLFDSANTTFVACLLYYQLPGSNTIAPNTQTGTLTAVPAGTYTLRVTVGYRNSGTAAATINLDNIFLQSAPTGLSGSAVAGTTNASLSWTGSTTTASGPTLRATNSYQVYRDSTPLGFTNTPTVSYTDSTTTGNTSYNYTLTDFDVTPTESPVSATAAILTLPGTPGTPTFSGVSTTSVTVNWTAPTGGATTYKVERAPDNAGSPGAWGSIATGVAGTSYTDSPPLTCNTKYWYHVRATNASGDGVFSGQSSQTTSACNSVPTLSIAEPNGTGDTVTVGTAYNITYSLADSDNVVPAAFYYDTDNTGLNGSAITGACATAVEGSGVTCSWDTTGMSPGSYYVYGITNDGVNPQVSAYSPGMITISSGPVCTPAAMTITVTPATQNVRAGFATTYTVMVTNNDSIECSDLTVNLGVVDNPVTPTANFALSTLSAASRVIAPQSSGNVTLTVTAQPAGVETSTLTSTVTATATGHAAQNDAAVSTIMNYNPMIHSSRSTNSTKWAGNGGWGIAGGKYGEFTCATCHEKGTGNIKRVKTVIDTPNTDPWVGSNTQTVAVTLAATTGASSYGDDGRATLTSSNMVCEVCHSATTAHRYNSSTGVTDFNHMDSNQGDCISCHAHNKGFDASCTTCHGYPPVDAGTLVIVTSRPTGSATAGAHNTHVATFSISCATCHYNSAGSGATHNVNGQVSLGFVNLPTGTGGVSSGSYNGQGTVTYNSTDAGTSVSSGGTKTCTNYCHGSTIGAAGAVWDNPATGECGDCHGAVAATPPTRVNHPRHVGTAAGQLGLTCDQCHGLGYVGGTSAPAGHLSGSVRYDVSGLTGNTPTYRGFSTVQQTGALAPSGTYGNCGNVYCHSNVQSVNGTAAASIYATPTWGAASVACDSCHGQAAHANGQPSTGSHEIHVTTRGYACSACHTGAGDETVNHADGQIDISLSGGGTYTQGNHAPGSGGYGTCSSVACHNGKTTLAWGNTTGGCILCHTVDGTNSATVANPVSGLHSNTIASVQDHDNTLAGGCEACHVKASITGHWNGTASATVDYTKAAVGITAAMYTDAGGVLATRGTCMGTSDLTSCHTDKGNWRRQWSTDADADIVAGSKLPGQAVCNVCHGQYSTLTNSDGWSEGTVHYLSSDLADKTTENKGIIHTDAGDECEDCHGYDSVAVHNSNNKIDFSDLGNPNGYAVTLNATPNPDVWYCADCHNTQNAQVATLTDSRTFLDSLAFPNTTNPINHVVGTSIPVGSCYGCHGDGAAEYWPQNVGNTRGGTLNSDYNNAGAHQKHIEVLAARIGGFTLPGDDTQQKAMCAYCHTISDGDHMTKAAGSYAEVFPVGGKKSLWNGTDSDATFFNTTSTYNCTTTDCHNSKDTTTTYAWYSGATSTCVMCHSVGAGNNPNSGLHTTTAPTVTGISHDDAFGSGGTCASCHTMTGKISATIGTHVNNIFTSSGTTDPNLIIMGLPTAASNRYTSSGTDSIGSCSGTTWPGASCHAGGDGGTWARKWDSAVSNATTGAECNGCHGGPDGAGWVTGVLNHDQNWNTPSDAVSDEIIGNHGGNTDQRDRCRACHVYNDTVNNTYKDNAGGKIGWVGNVASNSTYHGNGAIDFNINRGYNSTTFTCTEACHTAAGSHAMADSGWTTVADIVGSPTLSCSGCHPGITAHTDADGVGATWVAGQCEACHDTGTGSNRGHWVLQGTAGVNRIGISTISGRVVNGSGEDTGTLIPSLNNQYATHDSYILLGGQATNSATTEAEMCWGCHQLPATDISEWGTNTGGTYNYGTVTNNNLNWTTTTWSSANASFSYKNGLLRTRPFRGNAANATDLTTRGDASIHATGGTVGTPSNTLADVKCSYCHDVHDTHGTNGKPYLRAAWRPNPYKEDGAPIVGGQTYSATQNFGAVPRGGGTNLNVLGGWQIDINNGNPNSAAYAYATQDALCASCHTQTAVQTAAPLHKNSVKGFANDTTNSLTSTNRNILRVGTYTGTDYHPSRGGTMTAHGSATVGAPKMGYNVTADTGATATEQNGLRDVDRDNAWVAGNGIYNLSGTNTARYAYQAIPLSAAGVSGITQDLTTVQADYHSFTCSKCHNPHASRLPRLMITNCLDVNNNTWDDTLTLTTNPGYTRSTANNPANINTLAYFSSAQNCHRYTENASGATRGTVMEKGWNAVTPW